MVGSKGERKNKGVVVGRLCFREQQAVMMQMC